MLEIIKEMISNNHQVCLKHQVLVMEMKQHSKFDLQHQNMIN